MNKRTVALTTEQYREIVQTMKSGFCGCRPNPRVAAALMLEGNLGIRVSDVVKLRLSDIVHDGERYRLSIIEQKTGKARTFTVPVALYQFLRIYCLDNSIAPDAVIIPLIYGRSVIILAMRESVHTASASGTRRKSTGQTATISHWCSSFYSTAARL